MKEKVEAIWTILTSKQYVVVTKTKEGYQSRTRIKASPKDMIRFYITLKDTIENLHDKIKERIPEAVLKVILGLEEQSKEQQKEMKNPFSDN